jgi:hypothetical protein
VKNKEKLEELNRKIDVPKIKPVNIEVVLGVVEKLLKDSNANVAHAAIKTVGILANGMKSKWIEPPTKMLISNIIANVKHKRPQILQDVGLTLEKLLLWISLNDIIEPISESLTNKSPVIVKKSTEFLQHVVKEGYLDEIIEISDSFWKILMDGANHSDGGVRDCWLATLGWFKARIGDDKFDKYASDLNQQKLTKIDEAAQAVPPLDPKKKTRKKKKAKKQPEPEEEAKDELVFDFGGPPKAKKKKPKGPPKSFFDRQNKMKQKAEDKFNEMKNELGANNKMEVDEPVARPQTAQPSAATHQLVRREAPAEPGT